MFNPPWRIARLIWPPFGAHLINRNLRDAAKSDLTSSELEEIVRGRIDKEAAEDAEKWAKLVFESEAKRKDTLENKASSYMFAMSISVGVVALIPNLFSNQQWLMWRAGVVAAGVSYGLSAICLLAATYYSVKARRSEALAMPTVDYFLESLKKNDCGDAGRIAMYLGIAKHNEPLLTIKSNYLSWMCPDLRGKGPWRNAPADRLTTLCPHAA